MTVRVFRAWLVYLAVVFVGGAVLAPWLYLAVQSAAAHWPTLAGLARNPFSRFVNRSLLVLAIAGLWPLLRHLNLRSWAAVGLPAPRRHGPQLRAGLTLGLISLALVMLLVTAAGARAFVVGQSAGAGLEHLAQASLAAVVVGVLEEALFRGALYGSLAQVVRWPVAALLSSLLYAWAHFFAPVTWTAPVDWSTGLAVLARMFGGFLDWQSLVPAFLNLTVGGLVLALAYQRTGTLWFAIGLHGGWVFWLKSYRFLTCEVPQANTWFWGTGKLIDGWAALPVLAMCGWLVAKWLRPAAAAEPQ